MYEPFLMNNYSLRSLISLVDDEANIFPHIRSKEKGVTFITL